MNDVWVPANFSIDGHRTGAKVSLQLTFDWSSINQSISDSAFQWEKWNLPKGSRVVDSRLGRDKPILVERAGYPMEQEIPSTGDGLRQKIFIIVSVVVCGIAVGWLLMRWRAMRGA